MQFIAVQSILIRSVSMVWLPALTAGTLSEAPKPPISIGPIWLQQPAADLRHLTRHLLQAPASGFRTCFFTRQWSGVVLESCLAAIQPPRVACTGPARSTCCVLGRISQRRALAEPMPVHAWRGESVWFGRDCTPVADARSSTRRVRLPQTGCEECGAHLPEGDRHLESFGFVPSDLCGPRRRSVLRLSGAGGLCPAGGKKPSGKRPSDLCACCRALALRRSRPAATPDNPSATLANCIRSLLDPRSRFRPLCTVRSTPVHPCANDQFKTAAIGWHCLQGDHPQG